MRASYGRGRHFRKARRSRLISTREMGEKTPTVSIALANDVLPPCDNGRVIRRQRRPQEMIQ